MRINNRITWMALTISFAAIWFGCGSKQEASNQEEDISSDTTTTEASHEDESKAPIASPRKQAEGTLAGGVEVKVDYGSPGVKDRKIWGGLEDYGVVWRAGANETTAITFGADVTINGTKVEAGTYGLYIIPKENADWTVIINTDWDREKHGAWGAYNYNEDHDVVRVDVTPTMTDEVQERLMYTVQDDGVGFAWEKVRLTLPIEKAGE